VWKRVVAAKELFRLLGDGATGHRPNEEPCSTGTDGRENQTRQFLLRVANRIFTEQALSQAEVVAHFQGYGTEFTSSNAWTFLNVCTLYWHIFRRWPLLRHAASREKLNEPVEETILLGESGQKVSLLQAYPHRGRLLEGLALYDYMSVIKLKRKGQGVCCLGRHRTRQLLAAIEVVGSGAAAARAACDRLLRRVPGHGCH
jgi:hypothetical protein